MGGFLEAGAPEYASPYYVSPTGTGDGTQGSPMALDTALSVATSGEQIICMDGLYQLETVAMSAGITMSANGGARPIISRANGYPPVVLVRDNCILSGIWFGGTKDTQNQGVITMGDNCQITDNTFYGYYNCIAEGGHVNNLYQSNRFINCGTGGLYHDIYISGNSSSRIYDNIHIGGEGYKIHLWHSAANADIQRNFMAECSYEMVLQHITSQAINNIFWNHTPPEMSWLTVNISKGIFTHNLFGHRTFGTGKWDTQMNGGTADEGLTVNLCGYVGDRYLDTTTWPGEEIYVGPYNGDPPTLPAPGTNYTHYAVEDLPALLGYSEAQIDTATAALITAFSQTAQQIHDDATIETQFTILEAVVNAWKLQ